MSPGVGTRPLWVSIWGLDLSTWMTGPMLTTHEPVEMRSGHRGLLGLYFDVSWADKETEAQKTRGLVCRACYGWDTEFPSTL